jgi:hypothetical protein
MRWSLLAEELGNITVRRPLRHFWWSISHCTSYIRRDLKDANLVLLANCNGAFNVERGPSFRSSFSPLIIQMTLKLKFLLMGEANPWDLRPSPLTWPFIVWSPLSQTESPATSSNLVWRSLSSSGMALVKKPTSCGIKQKLGCSSTLPMALHGEVPFCQRSSDRFFLATQSGP